MNRLEALRLELDSRRRTVHDLQGKPLVSQHPATLVAMFTRTLKCHALAAQHKSTNAQQQVSQHVLLSRFHLKPTHRHLPPAGKLTRITSTLGSSRSKGEAELEITNRKMMHKENKSNRE